MLVKVRKNREGKRIFGPRRTTHDARCTNHDALHTTHDARNKFW